MPVGYPRAATDRLTAVVVDLRGADDGDGSTYDAGGIVIDQRDLASGIRERRSRSESRAPRPEDDGQPWEVESSRHEYWLKRT